MSQLEQQFAQFGVVRGGELFLPPEQAIQLVLCCEEQNLRVLGAEVLPYRDHN